MADYISREAAVKKLRQHKVDPVKIGFLDDNIYSFNDGIDTAISSISVEVPAADVRPVVRGRWEWNKHYGLYQCSNCHNSYVDIEWVKEGKWKYCPSCGADMRKEKKDDKPKERH